MELQKAEICQTIQTHEHVNLKQTLGSTVNVDARRNYNTNIQI